jgi:hypothetical protein
MVGHPFIFVTVPKSLDILRTLGYKTFHPYINEDYDHEFDNNMRFKKILKELERICNMSDREVTEFVKNVKPICEHNQKILKVKTFPAIHGLDPGRKILHAHFIRKTL